MINLQNNMLASVYRAQPLGEIIEHLERAVANRQATIDEALNAPNPTIASVTDALLKENTTLIAGAMSSGSTPMGISSGAAAVDRDGKATTTALFKVLERNITGYNLLTETGRRDALTAGLASGDTLLVTRVLFREYHAGKEIEEKRDRMATRNDMLGSYNGLRPYLHEYFNWYMRYDVSTGAENPRLRKYEFASLQDRSLLVQLTSLQVDQMDFVAAPGGMLGYYQHRDAWSTARHIDPRDYYCSVRTVYQISEFMSKLLSSFGIPEALPVGAAGYTFKTFCDFYVRMLQLAERVPYLHDQYEHLAACDAQFRAALASMRIVLQAVLGHQDIGSQTFKVAILAEDSEPIKRLKALETEILRKIDVRADLGSELPRHHNAAPAVDIQNLKLSDPTWGKIQKPKGKRKSATTGDGDLEPPDKKGALPAQGDLAEAQNALLAEQAQVAHLKRKLLEVGAEGGLSEEELARLGKVVKADGALPPGVLAGSWRWLDAAKHKLCISGRVWNVKELAKHLGVPIHGHNAPCWPYVLALCEDKNRPARCDHWGEKGHASAKDHAHKCLDKINSAALKDQYSTVATKEDKANTSKEPDWSKAPQQSAKGKGKGRGKGRGRGARGRGRGQHGQGEDEEPHFRQPLLQ